MPSNLLVPIISSPFVSKRNEKTITLVLDAEDAIVVEVARRPDDNPGMESALETFGRACHDDILPSPGWPNTHGHGDPWGDVASGRALWQNAETLRWNIRISGVDRVLTHQLVRLRVGVTFSHQCTGDRDCRWDSLLLPRSIGEGRGLAAYELVRMKTMYSSLVDSGGSVQEARRFLPHCISSHIQMDTCLTTLAGWYRKRREHLTQDWLTYVLAGKIREAVVAASPWAASAFPEPTPKGSWYDRVKENGWSVSHLFSPKGTPYDNWDWNPGTFEHGEKSHEEVSSGPPREPILYVNEVCIASDKESVASALYEMALSGQNGAIDRLLEFSRIYPEVYAPEDALRFL